MCHTCPSVADFELCEPAKKNYPLLKTLVSRLTSIRSQAGNLSRPRPAGKSSAPPIPVRHFPNVKKAKKDTKEALGNIRNLFREKIEKRISEQGSVENDDFTNSYLQAHETMDKDEIARWWIFAKMHS